MTDTQKNKIVFSGIQPSGSITLGNYIGAVKNWVALQDNYRCIYCVVNQHAITVRVDAKQLRKNTMEAYALLMACGVNPEENILFVQSDVPAHSQLSWAMNCFTPFGELSRMTQFKEKSEHNNDNINAGLFTYPVLMAADILLYQTDLVPVGEDQKQHLELARNIAERLNGLYGNIFKVPDPYIPKLGARIMSLSDPTRKMSKSDPNPKGTINILDEPETIVKKFKSAVTDSDNKITLGKDKDGINNLITIYSSVTGKTAQDIEKQFESAGYGEFKLEVGRAVACYLEPIREKFKQLIANPQQLEICRSNGAEKANFLAKRTIEKTYKKLGF